MSEENDVVEPEVTMVQEAKVNEPLVQDELASLKKRADMVGFKYHHKVGAKKLKAQLEAHIAGESVKELKDQKAQEKKEAKATKKAAKEARKALKPVPETKQQRLRRMRQEAGKLVRVRVSNMNPNKKDYDGEIFTVGNSAVGTFKKFVPYNIDNGWHVPQIILTHMQEKECQIFFSIKAANGQKVRKGKLIKEFNIEIMDPLTAPELQELASQQAMAGGVA